LWEKKKEKGKGEYRTTMQGLRAENPTKTGQFRHGSGQGGKGENRGDMAGGTKGVADKKRTDCCPKDQTR